VQVLQLVEQAWRVGAACTPVVVGGVGWVLAGVVALEVVVAAATALAVPGPAVPPVEATAIVLVEGRPAAGSAVEAEMAAGYVLAEDEVQVVVPVV
jgi:hypothetical protein